jgi:hypothetical protein
VNRLAAAFVLFCLPVAAIAAEPETPAAGHEHAPANPEKPKKVCRTETKTGSVMPKRVCRTPEQIKAQEEATQRELDRNQRGA